MTYKIIFDAKEYDDNFGHHEAQHREFDISYKCYEDVWYCYKRGRKYVVRESRIRGVWATNMVGVTLDNNWHVGEYEFDRLIKQRV